MFVHTSLRPWRKRAIVLIGLWHVKRRVCCLVFFFPLALLRWSSSLLKYPVVYGRFSPFLNYFPQYFPPLLPPSPKSVCFTCSLWKSSWQHMRWLCCPKGLASRKKRPACHPHKLQKEGEETKISWSWWYFGGQLCSCCFCVKGSKTVCCFLNIFFWW